MYQMYIIQRSFTNRTRSCSMHCHSDGEQFLVFLLSQTRSRARARASFYYFFFSLTALSSKGRRTAVRNLSPPFQELLLRSK